MSEQLAIARVGAMGDGIAETPAGRIYVPYTLPNETVEVARWPRHPDRRHLVKIDVASPDRIAPICPHFGVCGGCALQHWASASYRDWKRELVVVALDRVGLAPPVGDLIDAHGEGRRRAVFHARSADTLLEVGFSARKAHHVVAIDRCPVLAPGLDGAITAAWALAEKLAAVRKPLDIQVTATDEGLDIDLRGSGPLSPGRMQELAQLAARHHLARLTRHGEIVAQQALPMVRMGRARVVLPPGAFLQATAAAEAILAELAETYCRGAGKLADLFCGVGPFALRLADHARIVAVDNDAVAVAALRRAADTTARLKPIETHTRDLFRRPFTPDELKPFDAVLFDPPRQGAQAQASAIAASGVPRVVALSCNPATFARDARILADGGYQLTRVTPVDQFRYSAHVEVVGLFETTDDRRRTTDG
jgi:23S rRNA (uracil1939-C5)-methyltransferase